MPLKSGPEVPVERSITPSMPATAGPVCFPLQPAAFSPGTFSAFSSPTRGTELSPPQPPKSGPPRMTAKPGRSNHNFSSSPRCVILSGGCASRTRSTTAVESLPVCRSPSEAEGTPCSRVVASASHGVSITPRPLFPVLLGRVQRRTDSAPSQTRQNPVTKVTFTLIR